MDIVTLFGKLLRRRDPAPAPADFESGLDVQFTKLKNTDLKPVAVAAQCLDNQWVSQDLLSRMFKKDLSFEDSDVQARRLSDARAEYLRALLNAEQVVVNRAFFFNTPVVYRDFQSDGNQRDTFKSMLNTGVIVPFLLTENSPGAVPKYGTDKVGWASWKRLLPETQVHCARLSWDDDTENSAFVRAAMFQRFREFLARSAVMDRDGLRRDLDLDGEQAKGLLTVLKSVATWSFGEENPTREELYKRFIVKDGTNPADGHFDRRKPFAAELKQLVDLRYNTNLPDALDKFPITPIDSLYRTALQEQNTGTRPVEPIDPDELANLLLRRTNFDLVQRALSVPLTGLDLSHVWQARHTDEWHSYIRDLRALIDRPAEFPELAQDVYTSYVGLAGRLAGIVGARPMGPAWEPTIKLVVEVLGATLELAFGGSLVATVVCQVASAVGARSSAAVVRLVVAGHHQRTASRELSTGIELMRRRLTRTQDDWNTLIDRLERRGVPVRRLDREAGVVEDSTIDGLDPEHVPA